MRKRNRRKTILLILGILAGVVCVLLFATSRTYEVKIKPKSAEDLLKAEYYDFTDSAAYYELYCFHDYTFIVSDQKMLASDIHALTEANYQRFAEAVPQPVYVSWDEETEQATVVSEEEGRALGLDSSCQYYMLDSGENGLLLIPAYKIIRFFEPLRPLAYYLQFDHGEKTQLLKAFIETYSSEEDIQRFVDATAEMDLREDQRKETALLYYHRWMTTLFETNREYPIIREVSLVPAPDIIIDEKKIEKEEETAINVKLNDSQRNTYLIYLQDRTSGLDWNVVMYNGDVLRALFVR